MLGSRWAENTLYIMRWLPTGSQLGSCSSLTVQSKSSVGEIELWLLRYLAAATGQNLTSCPSIPDISKLTSLRILDISGIQIISVPDGISQLTNLAFLRLNHNKLTTIPEGISCLTNLTFLAIDENPIRVLPPGITRLQKLKKLYIQDGDGVISVECAPIGISNLPCWNCYSDYGGITISKALRGLTLYATEEEEIMTATKLDLSRSGLTSIPNYVSNLINLKELSIYRNPIEELPPWITTLTDKLETLHIEGPNDWWPTFSVKRAPVGIKLMKCWRQGWDRKITLQDMKFKHEDKGLQDKIDESLSKIKQPLLLETNAGQIFDTQILRTYKSLGAGGYGVVFEIIYKTNKCALKIPKYANYCAGRFISIRCGKDEVSAEEISREFEIVTKLKPHDNIVKVLDFVILPLNEGDNQFMCFIMELADCSLKDEILKNWANFSNKETYNRGKKNVKDILHGIAYLHSNNIVHRDLKTENILICGSVAKITDFGLSKKLEYRMQPVDSRTGVKGTFHWGSPEYFDGDIKIQKAADIFVVGTILWAMRTRKEPFEDFSQQSQISLPILKGHRLPLPPENPSFLEDMIEMCWHNVPKLRQSAYGLLNIIERFEEFYEKEDEVTEEYCTKIWGINKDFEDAWSELVQRTKEDGLGLEIWLTNTEKAAKVKWLKYDKYTRLGH